MLFFGSFNPQKPFTAHFPALTGLRQMILLAICLNFQLVINQLLTPRGHYCGLPMAHLSVRNIEKIFHLCNVVRSKFSFDRFKQQTPALGIGALAAEQIHQFCHGSLRGHVVAADHAEALEAHSRLVKAHRNGPSRTLRHIHHDDTACDGLAQRRNKPFARRGIARTVGFENHTLEAVDRQYRAEDPLTDTRKELDHDHALAQRGGYAQFAPVVDGVGNGGMVVGEIGQGLLVLVGIVDDDSEEDEDYIAKKIVNLRIFDDENKVMNKSLLDIGGEVLCVSQFTLHALTKKGNRPSYIMAAKGEVAEPKYDSLCKKIGNLTNKNTKKGIFGEDMQVSLLNDGPVTIIMDSKNKE